MFLVFLTALVGVAVSSTLEESYHNSETFLTVERHFFPKAGKGLKIKFKVYDENELEESKVWFQKHDPETHEWSLVSIDHFGEKSSLKIKVIAATETGPGKIKGLLTVKPVTCELTGKYRVVYGHGLGWSDFNIHIPKGCPDEEAPAPVIKVPRYIFGAVNEPVAFKIRVVHPDVEQGTLWVKKVDHESGNYTDLSQEVVEESGLTALYRIVEAAEQAPWAGRKRSTTYVQVKKVLCELNGEYVVGFAEVHENLSVVVHGCEGEDEDVEFFL